MRTHWLIVVGAAVVGAGLIAALGHRTGELLEREQQTAAELAQLNRVRDAFLRMVAHDLRTPLSTMVMNAETIEAYLDDMSRSELREMIARQVAQGKRLTRMVGDRGPGVPEDARQTIFDLFAHGSDTRENTGLGLALVGEIAAAHGGRCWVEDRDAGGASFRVLRTATSTRTSDPDRCPCLSSDRPRVRGRRDAGCGCRGPG